MTEGAGRWEEVAAPGVSHSVADVPLTLTLSLEGEGISLVALRRAVRGGSGGV
jgi:hypothetical protein